MTTPDGPMDGRLGRRYVDPDPRNRDYPVRTLLDARGTVERKPTFWPMPGGPFPLDQGQEGACEAFGFAHELAAGPIVIPDLTNSWALDYYQRVRATDRSMGYVFDSGATTLGNMKTALAENRITGYRWAQSTDDVVDTVCSVGPVCLGVDWSSSMYRTTAAGQVTVTGPWVGGHFITVLGYDVHPLWGPCVLWLNSWGRGYGVAEPRLNLAAGVGWLPLQTLDYLLRRNGEAVVPSDWFGTPAPAPGAPAFFATRRGHVFHTARHPLVRHDRSFASREDAVAAGLRACKLCKP